MRRDAPVWRTEDVLYGFYPSLSEVAARRVSKDDGPLDVLVLGGSVVSRHYIIRELLEQNLSYRLKRRIRIHLLAKPAHTTRDSLLKYRSLGDKHFDVVLVYHGINDTRAVNCPPEIFKDDYTHYTWYRSLSLIEPYAEAPTGFMLLPYTVHFIGLQLKEQLGIGQVVPFHSTRKDWLANGDDHTTMRSFHKNLSQILKLARERDEKLLLMTFASYIPDDYTLEKFKNKQLDYTTHKRAVEVWGVPEKVQRRIAAHNAVVRQLAAEHNV
ncbi:hypothetical protein ACFL6C_02805, partial [Myxococcota bacterium]